MRAVWLCSISLLAPLTYFVTSYDDKKDLLAGESMWMTHCSGCHGDEGSPNLPGIPDISLGEGTEKSHHNQLTIIRNGSGIMPPYTNFLSDDDMENIVAFMVTLFPEPTLTRLEMTDPNLI